MARRKNRDMIEGSGFRFERMGPTIIGQSWRTPEEHRQLQQRMLQAREEIPGHIERLANELDEILIEFDSFDIIANFVLSEAFVDPETYKEPLHEGKAAYLEYVALRCLSRPYLPAKRPGPPNNPSVERIRLLLQKIFTQALWWHITEGVDPNRKGPPSALESLRFTVINEQILVRTPWYHYHYYPFLGKLFEPFNEWFLNNAGFTIAEAIKLVQYIPEVVSERLVHRREEASKTEAEMKAAYRRYRRTGQLEPSIARPSIRQIQRMG